MGAPKKNKIKEDLEAWTIARAKLIRLEAKRDEELAPILEKHEAELTPLEEKHSKKIDPLEKEICEIEARIEAELGKGVTGDGVKVMLVEIEFAAAEVLLSNGAREVDPETLYKSVKPHKRTGAAFWSCFKVKIAPTEALLGAGIDAIAKMKRTWSVNIREKEEES